jgi:hypothetical protein
VAAITIGEHGIVIIDYAPENTAQHCQGKFRRRQPPELIRQRGLVVNDGVDEVDDQLGHPSGRDRNQGSDGTKNQAENDDSRAGIPNDAQNRRDVLECPNAVFPSAEEWLL